MNQGIQSDPLLSGLAFYMEPRTGTHGFRQELSRRAIVADGATGTMLQSQGLFINRSYDEPNLSGPRVG